MIVLSYPLGPSTPSFYENPKVEIEAQAQVEKDGYAQYFVRTINHAGTHIDAPAHIDAAGPAIDDFPLETLRFEAPRIIDLPKQEGELITDDDLRPHEKTIAEADIVLFRTGFSAVRGADPITYGRRNPGFARSAGAYLWQFTPHLRAIAMDLPSAASALHLEEGGAFHHEVLGRFGTDGHCIFLIEDAKIEPNLKSLSWVMCVPWYMEDVDSTPCTLIGGID